jgi:DNA-binding transcriptional LysR family regulator
LKQLREQQVQQADEIDLNGLPLFLVLMEAGGFTAAAERLGCSKTRVSLTIRQLEERLGATLFQRTTRKVQPTQTAERLYHDCKPLLSQLQEALSAVEGDNQSLSGELRLAAPEDYAARVVGPAVAAFGEQHPALRIELRGGDQRSNMLEEGVDIAFRLGWLKDSSLRARRLGEFQQYLVASPDYLDRKGTPTHPTQLTEHAWLAFTPLNSPLTWVFRSGNECHQVRMHAQLAVNSTAAQRALLLAGAGVSVMVDFTAEAEIADGKLVRILPEWSLPVGNVHAVYPPGRYLPARVKYFMDFFQSWISGKR